ncbi:hypothetical protein D3C84_1240530 [compost metagenome]
MGKGEHPAGILRIYAAPTGTVNYPASRLYSPPFQTLQRSGIELAQMLRLDAQYQGPVQL